MTDTDAPEWPDPADKAHAVEQAKRLRDQLREERKEPRQEPARWEKRSRR